MFQMKPTFQRDCCQKYYTIPDACIDPYLPEICCELEKLKKRHEKLITKRSALLRLAEPRCRYQKYVRKCPCRFANPIQMIRLYDNRERTRTDQLALPHLWKLLLFKREFSYLFTKQRIDVLHRLMRKSLFSVYSRLANVQPPVPRVPIHKWDKLEWRKHRAYARRLARPKKQLPQPKIPKQSMPLESMKRYKKLARPKKYIEEPKEDWKLTPNMKFYSPSERIVELAKPREFDDNDLFLPVPTPVSANAKAYKASERIKTLAVANEKRTAISDLKENPFQIAPNALKYKASERILELAEPKEFENVHLRENPNLISPAALKAKASPRTIELAKPKGS